ncbi:FdxN element excision controlling factor protein (plasmid) [Leptolyngbya sp. NIES-3755]|nr:FdxN element excision controlling factor protein [Leptolyngbya sp. NIES-3755]
MSKRDRYHNALRRTLEKDGWTITADPLILRLEGNDLKADLGAEKTFAAEKAGRKIAIELKEFTAISAVSELEKTIGQLQLYQWALDGQEPDRRLFLAVSEMAYVKHFEKPLFQLVMQRNKINLLIYQPESEEIVEWITHNDMPSF